MRNRQYFRDISDARKMAEKFRDDAESAIGRLERRIPIYLLMAIVSVICFKAGVTGLPITALFVSVMIVCSIHLAYLIRGYQKNIAKCNEILTKHLKDNSPEDGQFSN